MPRIHTAPSAGARALVLLAGVAVAVLANTAVAISALSAGANPAFTPLSVPVYGAFTVGGFLVGFAGWQLIRRHARRPRTILRLLVPAVLIVSLVPDIGILASGAIPGTSVSGVTALMIMHLIVAAVAVPVYERVAPVSDRLLASQGVARVSQA